MLILRGPVDGPRLTPEDILHPQGSDAWTLEIKVSNLIIQALYWPSALKGNIVFNVQCRELIFVVAPQSEAREIRKYANLQSMKAGSKM